MKVSAKSLERRCP